MNKFDFPSLREAVERRRRCGCEKCEGCGTDRDALVDAAPALLDEVEALRRERNDGIGLRMELKAEIAKLRADLTETRGRVCGTCEHRTDMNGEDYCSHTGGACSCAYLGNTCGAWAAKEQP